jgi:transposase, IS5 family
MLFNAVNKGLTDMRIVKNEQMELGEIAIEDIKIDAKSRDDIPQILRGLQYLYVNREIRDKIFSTLEKLIPSEIDKKNGRPGMHLWRIFVLGMVRLNLNCDYDRLQELANNHKTLREILGHGECFEYYYDLQTIKDNIRLFSPKVLDEINQIVVEAGHKLVKKKIKI